MKNTGFLLIDKPAGITSFKVVSILRKITGIKKIGHTGTLDPFATGLLPICIGKATKLASFLSGSHKSYIAEIKLGIKTNTGDVTGNIIIEESIPEITGTHLDFAVNKILALTSQTPPPFSAVKVNGKRAYELSRKGEKVDIKPRPVNIDEFEIISCDLPVIIYKARVSKGTYIRTLSETFADFLGTIATTTALTRTEINSLKIDNAVKLDTLTSDNWKSHLIPPAEILDLPKITISADERTIFCHGNRLFTESDPCDNIIVLSEDDDTLGIASIKNDGSMQPRIVFCS